MWGGGGLDRDGWVYDDVRLSTESGWPDDLFAVLLLFSVSSSCVFSWRTTRKTAGEEEEGAVSSSPYLSTSDTTPLAVSLSVSL